MLQIAHLIILLLNAYTSQIQEQHVMRVSAMDGAIKHECTENKTAASIQTRALFEFHLNLPEPALHNTRDRWRYQWRDRLLISSRRFCQHQFELVNDLDLVVPVSEKAPVTGIGMNEYGCSAACVLQLGLCSRVVKFRRPPHPYEDTLS